MSDFGCSPTFMGVRQRAFNTDTTTSLDGYLPEGCKAGLSLIVTDSYHYDLYVTCLDGQYFIEVRKKVHDIEAIVFSQCIEIGEKIDLKIVSSVQRYQFYFNNSDDYVEIAPE